MSQRRKWCEEAAQIASQYNWPEYPDTVERIRVGDVPRNFGHEVGCTIALFQRSWPFGKSEQQEENDAEHVKRLSRLRVLVAKINREMRRT